MALVAAIHNICNCHASASGLGLHPLRSCLPLQYTWLQETYPLAVYPCFSCIKNRARSMQQHPPLAERPVKP